MSITCYIHCQTIDMYHIKSYCDNRLIYAITEQLLAEGVGVAQDDF
jgi:hypothetical protein